MIDWTPTHHNTPQNWFPFFYEQASLILFIRCAILPVTQATVFSYLSVKAFVCAVMQSCSFSISDLKQRPSPPGNHPLEALNLFWPCPGSQRPERCRQRPVLPWPLPVSPAIAPPCFGDSYSMNWEAKAFEQRKWRGVELWPRSSPSLKQGQSDKIGKGLQPEELKGEQVWRGGSDWPVHKRTETSYMGGGLRRGWSLSQR